MAFIITFDGPYNKTTRSFPHLEATVEGEMLHVMPGREVGIVKGGDVIAYFSGVRSARAQDISIYELATRGTNVDWGHGIGRGN